MSVQISHCCHGGAAHASLSELRVWCRLQQTLSYHWVWNARLDGHLIWSSRADGLREGITTLDGPGIWLSMRKLHALLTSAYIDTGGICLYMFCAPQHIATVINGFVLSLSTCRQQCLENLIKKDGSINMMMYKLQGFKELCMLKKENKIKNKPIKWEETFLFLQNLHFYLMNKLLSLRIETITFLP